MQYGIGVWELTIIEVSRFESTHTQMAKTVQGLPVFIADSAVLAILGWTSLQAWIENRHLLMLRKILSLNMDNIYMKIGIERLIKLRGKSNNCVSHDTILLMYKVCVKYGLDVHVKDILNSKIISNEAWKGLVNSGTMARENTTWFISICLYSSLRLYRKVFPMIGLCHWWWLADSKPHLRQCFPSVVQTLKVGLRVQL